MAYYSFTKSILAGEPSNVFNYGKMQRDFTYIDDIIEGVLRVIDKIPTSDLDASIPPYKIYNIGNNQPVKLLHFIEVLESHLGKKAQKNFLPMQAGDVPITYADVDDLVRDVGFRPSTPIEVGLEKFTSWFKFYYGI
jgi:UDP-glucuronate 4-epimerase